MHIYAFHRYLHRSALPSGTQAKQYRTHSPELSPGLSRTTYLAAYGRFTPSNSGQRSLPTYYRGCWHVVAGASSVGTVTPLPLYTEAAFFPTERSLQPEGRHPPRGVAASGFRPLRKIPNCCLP